ncbi:MAG: peptidoglycan recognition family protein [Candidatus Pacebacteria bacterium]|nr:peptidoglycan recognition family protein [Candidatus Paceibacterota bacterium]
MFSSKKSFILIVLAVFFITATGIAISLEFKTSNQLTSSLIQFESETIKDSSCIDADLDDLNLDIPQHINLTDFYKSFGQRLLGNENLEIISREQWGADNQYASLDFIKDFCENNFCYPGGYNPEDNFSKQEYWNSKELALNYRQNFQLIDSFFRQSLEKENGLRYYYLPIEEIIIHHTAGNFTFNFEESKEELRRIYLMQAVQRKWQDIGYHYLIDGAGRIYEGNLGGKYAVGVHSYGHNNATISISLMGDFRPGHDELNTSMQKSLINLIKYLVTEYNFDLSQKEFYLRKPNLAGREWTENFVKGHQEIDIKEEPTECPGVSPDFLRNLIYPYILEDKTLATL